MKAHHFLASLTLAAFIPVASATTAIHDPASGPVANCHGGFQSPENDGQAPTGHCSNYFDIATTLDGKDTFDTTFTDSAIKPGGLMAGINRELSDFSVTTPAPDRKNNWNLDLTHDVPEPGIIAMLGVSFIAVGVRRTFRRKKGHNQSRTGCE